MVLGLIPAQKRKKRLEKKVGKGGRQRRQELYHKTMSPALFPSVYF
jgi:hypothetical protein